MTRSKEPLNGALSVSVLVDAIATEFRSGAIPGQDALEDFLMAYLNCDRPAAVLVIDRLIRAGHLRFADEADASVD